MPRISLKKVLQKEAALLRSIDRFLDGTGQVLAIRDERGRLLYGSNEFRGGEVRPLFFEGKQYGEIYDSAHCNWLDELLISLLKKETECRLLGAEVLDMYREINLIYQFTQKLSDTIDQHAIAQLLLQEACSILPNSSGYVFRIHAGQPESVVVAKQGSEADAEAALCQYGELLRSAEPKILDQLPSSRSAATAFAPLKINERVLGGILLVGVPDQSFTAADLKLLTTLAQQATSAIESARLFEKNIQEVRRREAAVRRLHEAASRFVPTEFICSLGYDQITEVSLGDSVEREVTVLFSDIRGYTSLSERMTPSETFEFICSFNKRMGPIIRKHRGFINQYLGDGIMALFPEAPAGALRAAIEMQQALTAYNEERRQLGEPDIRIGIGLHTGPLVMGITGDNQRMDATTISDTVNTAARIESLTKQYGAQILFSESTLANIQPDRRSKRAVCSYVRYLGAAAMKGKSKPINIYECYDSDSPENIKLKREYMPKFSEGLYRFYTGCPQEAERLFEEIISVNPADRACAVFLERSRKVPSPAY